MQAHSYPAESDGAIRVDKPMLKSLLAMASLVEARDTYTSGHLWRVSQYARFLGIKMGLSSDEVFFLSVGAFLHDLGKVGVPDHIIGKKHSLSDDEYEVIKTHPSIGADLVREHPLGEMVLNHIFQHHERPDGQGYPLGIQGDALGLHPRIVGLVDAFDAMTSTRPYRAGLVKEEAMQRIMEGRGSQFDTEVVDAFAELVESGALDHIIGHSADGSPLQDCPVCGPQVIALPKKVRDGDLVICRPCAGEFRVRKSNGSINLEFTDRYASPDEVKPEVDDDLLDTVLNLLG